MQKNCGRSTWCNIVCKYVCDSCLYNTYAGYDRQHFRIFQNWSSMRNSWCHMSDTFSIKLYCNNSMECNNIQAHQVPYNEICDKILARFHLDKLLIIFHFLFTSKTRIFFRTIYIYIYIYINDIKRISNKKHIMKVSRWAIWIFYYTT